jgi:hypothetical protein
MKSEQTSDRKSVDSEGQTRSINPAPITSNDGDIGQLAANRRMTATGGLNVRRSDSLRRGFEVIPWIVLHVLCVWFPFFHCAILCVQITIQVYALGISKGGYPVENSAVKKDVGIQCR